MSRKLLSLSVAASLAGSAAWADGPRVTVDIAPLHSLVARVMDGVSEPHLLVPPGASPHEYNLRPSDAAALQDAELVFWIGEDFTPWMADAVQTLAMNATVTSLLEAEGTVVLRYREGALFEAHDHGDEEHAEDHDDHGHDHGDDHAEDGHGDHDHDTHDEVHHDDHAHEEEHDDHAHEEEHAEGKGHEHGHEHGEHDTHAWLSPDNAATWLSVIAARLSEADPANAETYKGNADTARTEIEQLKAEVNGILELARGKDFIVFHDAYQYFEIAFDFPAAGAISLSDASDPSPARIAEIRNRISEQGIDCVLAEPQFNSGLVAAVAEGTSAKTGVTDPLGAGLEPGPGLYPQLMRDLANALSECL